MVVGLYAGLDKVCDRGVSDGKEQSVDIHVIVLLFRCVLSFYHVHTLNAVLSIEACNVMLEQNLDVLSRLHSLLHNVRSTQVILAHHEVNLLAQS